MAELTEIPGLDRVLEYMDAWSTAHPIPASGYTDTQLAEFVRGLEECIAENVSFADPQGRSIIAYSGSYGDTLAWRIAKQVVASSGGKYCYISDIPAGALLENYYFKTTLLKVVGKDASKRILNGTTVDGVSTKYAAEDVLSLNDFVSQNCMTLNAHGDVLAFVQYAPTDRV